MDELLSRRFSTRQCLHYSILADYDDPKEAARAREAYTTLVDGRFRLMEPRLASTASVPANANFILREQGEIAVGTMRGIKQSIDANETLNPDNVVPYEGGPYREDADRDAAEATTDGGRAYNNE